MGSESRIVTRRGIRLHMAYGACGLSVALAAIFLMQVFSGPGEDTDIVSQGLSYGYMSFENRPAALPVASMQTSRTEALPSVPAMIGQLEDRLAREPDDAKGWSLLAQSYAYIGNASGAEHAIDNAVRLGVEENVIRSQIAVVSHESR